MNESLELKDVCVDEKNYVYDDISSLIGERGRDESGSMFNVPSPFQYLSAQLLESHRTTTSTYYASPVRHFLVVSPSLNLSPVPGILYPLPEFVVCLHFYSHPPISR